MVAQYPGAYNTYVKDHESTGNLTVTYSRNARDFPLNNYVQIVPVTEPSGLYLELGFEEAARILTTDGDEFAWPDNADAPVFKDNVDDFEFKQYRTKRRAYNWRFGNKTIDNASWDISTEYDDKKAQQAMTMRTKKVNAILTTSGNYDSSHVSAVTSISGVTGTWDASTTARMDIKKSINYAVNQIKKSTLSAVKKPSDMYLVIGPGLAAALSECQEIVDYIKGAPQALAQVKGELSGDNPNVGYDLPATLYGVNLIVEDSVVVTNRKGATAAKSFIHADATPFITSRPGTLEGKYGGPSFSTCSLYMYEEMSVERFVDEENRNTKGRVVEDYDALMTSSISGFLFTGAM